jgi:hypothetical protein
MKRRTKKKKKNIIAYDTFFIFYLLKKMKKAKVGQKLGKKVGSLSSLIYIYIKKNYSSLFN